MYGHVCWCPYEREQSSLRHTFHTVITIIVRKSQPYNRRRSHNKLQPTEAMSKLALFLSAQSRLTLLTGLSTLPHTKFTGSLYAYLSIPATDHRAWHYAYPLFARIFVPSNARGINSAQVFSKCS
jgi:hypothetical protein